MLVAVLGVLVVLAILAASIGAIVQRLRDQQLVRQDQLAADIDLASTRATALYLLTSQRMTFGGVTVDRRVAFSADERVSRQTGDESGISHMPVGNEIALDGSPYRGLGESRFALQDDRGLIAVNWAPPALLERYLSRTAQSAASFQSLLNMLADYQDPDDLYRLNSAEKEQYVARGRPPPTNRALTTPLELRRVAGWGDALATRSDMELVGSLTAIRSAQINVNTAPTDVLASLPGVDTPAAQRVLATRAIRPFTTIAEFRQIAGVALPNEDLLSLYPSASGTLKLWSRAGGTVQVLHWTLTPRDDGGRPWREDYEFTLPADERAGSYDARPVAAPVFTAPDAPQE